MAGAAALSLVAITAFGVAPRADGLAASTSPLSRLVRERIDWRAISPGNHFDRPFMRVERVRRGDTFGELAARLGVDDHALLDFIRHNETARALLSPARGRQITVWADADGRLQKLEYAVRDPGADSDGELLVIERSAAPERRSDIKGDARPERRTEPSFVARNEPMNIERVTLMRAASIGNNLFEAADSAGVPEEVTNQIADILSHQVDLNRRLDADAQFRVVYEMIQRVDSLDPPVPGRVLAIELDNGARHYRALWFPRQEGGEYFDYQGRPLRQGFLRSPLSVTRITSGFSDARMHPILHQMREHRGIDYAAPAGTTVLSIGDGVVEFIGQQRGYGNVIVLRHFGEYSTLYAHLRGFAKGLKQGSAVRIGTPIGQVGSSGMATGAHLHFEFRIAGEQADPNSDDLPLAATLTNGERMRFNELLAQTQSHTQGQAFSHRYYASFE